MTIKSSQTLVLEALDKIKTISAKDALKLSKDKQCNLVDIRDLNELQNEGEIENSKHIPRSMLEFWIDPQNPNSADIDPGKEIVLFCAGGLRSALAAKSLQDMGFDNVANAHGGFDLLKKVGLPVIAKEKK